MGADVVLISFETMLLAVMLGLTIAGAVAGLMIRVER